MDGKICIEQYMYDAYKRTEERVNQLKRALDAGQLTEAFIRIIFDWSAPQPKLVEQLKEELNKQEAPILIPADYVAPPPVRPATSKKHEMMKKVKELHLEGLNGKQIAEKTGLSEGTVSTYKKEMGLVGEASLTMINAPE